jgi:hypothetical protein
MAERFKLSSKSRTWQIMARKGAGMAADAAWLSLGGCPSQIVATRVYLALKAREALK